MASFHQLLAILPLAFRSCRGNWRAIAVFLSSFFLASIVYFASLSFHEQHDKSNSRDQGSLCLRLAIVTILAILRGRSTSVVLKLSRLEFLWMYLFSPWVNGGCTWRYPSYPQVMMCFLLLHRLFDDSYAPDPLSELDWIVWSRIQFNHDIAAVCRAC